jgi:phosphatidylserine decarboxylase
MIRFGSRTDVLVPRSTEILVHEGDYVRGGETIVGLIR